MLRIVICEDSKEQRENMVDYINMLIDKDNINARIIFDSGNYDDMLNFINTDSADLYVMDINLGEEDYRKNGFELSKIIREKSKNTIIIFISDYDNYMRQAFDIKAYHYLSKPINFDQFQKIFLEVYEEFNSIQKDECICKFSIPSDGIIHIIKVNDILYVEKIDTKRIRVNMIEGKKLETIMTLTDVENSCCSNALTRTHKSFLCNVNFIKTINMRKNEIVMNNGDIVLLGRTFKDDIRRICEKMNKIVE